MLKHAFSTGDLYTGLNNRLLKNKWIKNRKKDSKQLAAEIFQDCFYEILLDIIENNVTFVLPLKYGNYAEICMKRYDGEEFKKLYNYGKFSNIDFVYSQFSGNELTFKYKTNSIGLKEKPIYVNKELKKLIEKYTNESRQYY